VLSLLLLLAAPQAPPRDLQALLAADPVCAPFAKVPREHRLQVLLAEPETAADGRVTLRRSEFGDSRQYFYPASTVKLGAAITALLELQKLAQEHRKPLGLDSDWRFAARFQGDRPVDWLSVRTDLRRLFLVSDNPAYNHCFELCGPRRLNTAMWDAGFTSCRIWHRLSEPHPLRENRQTRAVSLRAGDSVLEIRERDEDYEIDNSAFTDLDVGKAHTDGDRRVEGPMSFAQKNAITLRDLQDLLVEVVRPEIDTGKRGFPGLGVGARAFVVQALGEYPRESKDPVWDPKEYPDEYCKYVLPGLRRVVPAAHLRVYDKIGRAWGFTIENAYVEDTRTGAGFFLAAVLYTNPDGLLGDDDYGYQDVSNPFFAALGEIVARAVWPPAPR
jgi:hypothetical protein